MLSIPNGVPITALQLSHCNFGISLVSLIVLSCCRSLYFGGGKKYDPGSNALKRLWEDLFDILIVKYCKKHNTHQ